MSIKKVTITCPTCGVMQDVELYESINVQTHPELKQLLLENRLNRINCTDCDANFRIDLPLLYSDPKHQVMIHWVPETETIKSDKIIEDFDHSIEQMNKVLPEDVTPPKVRLVLTRVELVELIFILEANMSQRVIEYIKYSIYTRNLEKVPFKTKQLLLNVQDSTEEELCFVVQDVKTKELSTILRYSRSAYRSMVELYKETPEDFVGMFPGPYISARQLLLDEEEDV